MLAGDEPPGRDAPRSTLRRDGICRFPTLRSPRALSWRLSGAEGGDWYDTTPIAGGRIVLVVMDAVELGVESVTAMGQLQSALAPLSTLLPIPQPSSRRSTSLRQGLARVCSSTCLLLLSSIPRRTDRVLGARQSADRCSSRTRADVLAAPRPPLALKRLLPRMNTVVALSAPENPLRKERDRSPSGRTTPSFHRD